MYRTLSRFGRRPAALAGACLLALSAAGAETPTEPEDTVTVTGSRLQRPAGPDPVVDLDSEYLRSSGATSLGEILQSLPIAAGSPLGTGVNARGAGGAQSRGTESVELRGLGEQRTLVLINGRRLLPGGNGTGGVPDLASVPLSLVERIEVVPTGASVAHGADALAGVVNIITRRFDGLEGFARIGQSGRGDGETLRLGAAWGRQLTDGQVSVGLELFDQASVGRGERDFSAQWRTVTGADNRIVPTGSSAPPNGRFRNVNRDFDLTLRDGEDGDRPEDFRPFRNAGPDTDRFNFNPLEDLQQDARRLSLFAAIDHALSDTLAAFGEALWQQRDSDTSLAPLPLFTNRMDGVTVAADNLFNPFDVEIDDARRRLVEGGGRRFVQDNHLWRLVAGLRGRWNAWDWDASVTHGRNTIDQRETGQLRRDRLRQALGPAFRDANGRAICGRPEAPIPDCVPLNLFGGPGSITPDMLTFAGLRPLLDRQDNDQTVVNVNLGGQPFVLPSGPAVFAAGIEYRDEQARDIPDLQIRAGNTTGATRGATRGSFASRELHAELGLPLYAAADTGHQLDAELGLRLVDASNFDRELVHDLGVLWQPAADWTLRASYARAFRAPTVGELFGADVQTNPIVEDPCADFSELSEVQIQRCVDQGVPEDGRFNQSGNETPTLTGGNPNLAPERADTFSAGLLYTPAALTSLSLRLDIYDISIDDAVTALGPNTVLDQCLATGTAVFCDRVKRAPDGRIEQVDSDLRNSARETARGLDLEARYRHPLGPGALSHRLLFSHVLERELRSLPGQTPQTGAGRFDPDNFGVIPRNQAVYQLRWNKASLHLGLNAQFLDSITDQGGEVFPGTRFKVASRLYLDLNAGMQLGNRWRLDAGIDNLADRDPPFIPNAGQLNTDAGSYRLLGRQLWLRLQARW